MVYTLQLYHAGDEIPSVSVAKILQKQKEKKKVLVVDDEPDVIITLKIGLEDTGVFEVYAYTDPEEVLGDFNLAFMILCSSTSKCPR